MDEKYYVQGSLAEIFKVPLSHVVFERAPEFDKVTYYDNQYKPKHFKIPKKFFQQITDYSKWIKDYFKENHPEMLL